MWDLLRGVLGLPPSRGYSDSTHVPGFLDRPSIWEDSGDESSMEDEMRQSPFSFFATSVDDDFHRQMNQLMQAMFGITSAFTQRPPIGHFDGSLGRHEDPPHHIRDQFFKPGAVPALPRGPTRDSDLDGQVDHDDVEKFFGGSSRSFQPAEPPQHQPRFYSRSVTTRTVRRSDGTVETVRTERDHTGREETTVTTYEPEAGISSAPVRPIQPSPHDDLLSKFFNF